MIIQFWLIIVSLSNYFSKQMLATPDGLAITDLSVTRTWQELDRNIVALAHYLLADAGMSPGDHIALMISNRVEYVESMLAGMLAGLWVTPINTHLTPAEIDYIRRDCGAKVVLHDDALAGLLLTDSTGELVNVQGLVEQLKDISYTAVDTRAPAGGNMLYTSGTTGKPKGVKRAKPDTVGEMVERMGNLGRAFGLIGRGPHMVTGPLYHAAPGMFAIYDMINGAPMIIMPKWDSEVFFQCVRDYRVSTTHLVPTMFVRLLQAHDQGIIGDIDISSLQYVLHGAAPITKAVKQRMIDWWGPILSEYWGATESGIVTLVNSSDWISHPGTVGRPVANFDVFVGDAQGNPSHESEGLLFCRHRQLAQVFSYHNDRDKTRKAHPQPHVFCLGDIGRIDEDGFIYLSDRESHMIISGGVNIYPTEVEHALTDHEDIVDAAVFGIPNAEWGEEVKAVVQLRPTVSPSVKLVDDIRNFLKGKIASFKVPRSIEFVEELPRNPSGKILVRQLKEQYVKADSGEN